MALFLRLLSFSSDAGFPVIVDYFFVCLSLE